MTSQPRKIELLAPARNTETGREAILHGADAVYIGAPAFGARAAATNSVADIANLAGFAHVFDAKVYVTLNTILYDDELDAARDLIFQLYDAGVDALIVQDMALLEMELPPIALHASTQMDITTAEHALFLEKAGFSQIVLARELGLDAIREIRRKTSVPLEAFVHGALCVSYSGRCYASQMCMGRSANRGECAQFCRLAFDLLDGKGNVLQHDKHLLSLRDMNRSSYVEDMLEAGISSLKIEGRLKDIAYVKNITAYYSGILDKIIAKRPAEFQRASAGKSEISFTPQPERSFNRGFTDYFLNGRSEVHQFQTPKSLGEKIGVISATDSRSFTVSTNAKLTAGDGLCYFDSDGKLQGIRANRVDANHIFPLKMPDMNRGMEIWRNHDQAFTTRLQSPSASRSINATISLRQHQDGYELSICDETGAATREFFPTEIQTAQKPQRENITRILSKTGGTALKIVRVEIEASAEPFIPSSILSEWRRQVVSKHISGRAKPERHDVARPDIGSPELRVLAKNAFDKADYRLNVSNATSEAAYRRMGIDIKQAAVELKKPQGPFAMMTCKHCLLFALGKCKKKTAQHLAEPLSLRLSDGRTFPLHFDCPHCEMQVMSN